MRVVICLTKFKYYQYTVAKLEYSPLENKCCAAANGPKRAANALLALRLFGSWIISLIIVSCVVNADGQKYKFDSY